MQEIVKESFELAKKARENSYSVYSKFAVGATIKVKGVDKLFTGCNVENSSFGGTICAERTALVKLVSELGGKPELEFVTVIADTESPTPPCGLCLQQLSDFVVDDTKVYLSNLDGIQKEIFFKEAMPFMFQFAHD